MHRLPSCLSSHGRKKGRNEWTALHPPRCDSQCLLVCLPACSNAIFQPRRRRSYFFVHLEARTFSPRASGKMQLSRFLFLTSLQVRAVAPDVAVAATPTLAPACPSFLALEHALSSPWSLPSELLGNLPTVAVFVHTPPPEYLTGCTSMLRNSLVNARPILSSHPPALDTHAHAHALQRLQARKSPTRVALDALGATGHKGGGRSRTFKKRT